MQHLIRRVALALFVASLVAGCAGHGTVPRPIATPSPTPAPCATVQTPRGPFENCPLPPAIP